MLGTAKAVTFVLTSNLERAKSFYRDKLGLGFLAQDDFAAVFDLNGATLRLTAMAAHEPSEHSVLGWSVTDIRETIQGLVALGIAMERYPFLEQDELGVWTSPDGVAKVAFFKDPDGNVLSLTQA